MRYLWHHFMSIIDEYGGKSPLSVYLKSFFRSHPKLGSRDRRAISDMVYCWYRCERAVDSSGSLEERVHQCLAACQKTKTLQLLFAETVYHPKELDNLAIFPFHHAFSAGISKDEWVLSMMHQPDFFIRVRKHPDLVASTLTEHGVPFTRLNDECFALPNGSDADKLLNARDFVVQDRSSQLTGSFFDVKDGQKWLDCCAGAGGKSLLLMDKMPGVKLTATDVRKTILQNLTDRFQSYRITAPETLVMDASDSAAWPVVLKGRLFDRIICDVPCSGSGTWARTPEQLYFFDPLVLKRYTMLQTAIASNAAKYLLPGGRLYYITCSVFEEENEQIIAKLVSGTSMCLLNHQLINGTQGRADSMFIAEFEHLGETH